MRINTNIPALQSYNALTATNNALQKSINKLSTGLRINSAADDAAGLAISEKMRAQYKGLDQAATNAQDGISMIQTAEGALNETHSILQRMRELAVQSANDTLTQEDRSYIQLEVDQLKEEITRISTTTQFNKKQLLDGSAAALWSSSDLTTRAIINGGLRRTDQFGQKNSVEGNYKIEIKATPGQGQVQKSDIFKIKHSNVIMGLVPDVDKGVDSVRVDRMPAGVYQFESFTSLNDASKKVEVAGNAANNSGALTGMYKTEGSSFSSAAAVGLFKFDSLKTIDNEGEQENKVNLSMLWEVVETNSAAKSVTFKVQATGLTTSGETITYNGGTLIVTTAGIGAGDRTDFGLRLGADGDIKLAAAGADGAYADFSVGDKFVITRAASDGTDSFLSLSGEVNNTGWEGSWEDTPGTKAKIGNFYAMSAGGLVDKDVHFKQYYINTQNGTVHEGDTVVEFNKNTSEFEGKKATLATFEAAYVGQIAKGDVVLRDLDKFWDANGKFMLDDPKTMTITQGDGKQASFTLYSTDTLEDVRMKMNEAINVGLGQGKYVGNATNNFVSYVVAGADGKTQENSSESVAGTFVIRSVVPGANGHIAFSGDEDIIKALSLNEIQASKESRYDVTITDAHSGNMVVNGAKVTGNKLVGTLHENVDVVFDAMANVDVTWNETSKKFDITRSSDPYTTILHLSDNTTVFQIGANQGEDMGVNIGNMSSEALGVDKLIVTDRENAARSITVIDNAINKVSLQRAKLGAYQNRLEHTINNLTTASTNLKSSESRIRDADMAKEMMEFTKLNILSQAGNSMLAQANQLPQNVLSLLR